MKQKYEITEWVGRQIPGKLWKPVSEVPERVGKWRLRMWLCECVCGSRSTIQVSTLFRSNGTSSCKRCAGVAVASARSSHKAINEDPTGAYKTCTRCKFSLDLSEFHKQVSNTDGRQTYCKTCVYEKGREVPTATRLWRNDKSRAAASGIEFSITPEDIHVPEFCPILGLPLVSETGHPGNGSFSLDRINSKGGYTPGNVQVVSYMANAMKRDASAEELLMFARWVVDTFADGGVDE